MALVGGRDTAGAPTENPSGLENDNKAGFSLAVQDEERLSSF